MKQITTNIIVDNLAKTPFWAYLLFMACYSGSAIGQTASSVEEERRTLEEIIVTARKKSESLLDIPANITTLNSDDLERLKARDFVDFASQVAGLQFQDLGPGDKEYIIRGINAKGPSTVGVYYGEGVVTASNQEDGGGRNIDIKLVDIKRIEVLNGPQGTLYGANSMIGTIKFLPNDPDPVAWDGFVEIDGSMTTEGGNNYSTNGMVNIPLGDTVALRLVGWTATNSGYIDQPRLGNPRPGNSGNAKEDANEEETQGGRIMFRFQPNDQLTLDAAYLVQNTTVGGSARYTPKGIKAFSTVGGGFAQAQVIPAFTVTDDLTNTDITASEWNDEFSIASFTLGYQFDSGSLVATTSFFDREIEFAFDSTPILLNFDVRIPGITLQPQSRSILSSEIRYSSDLDGRFNFSVGGFLQREEADFAVQVLTILDNGQANGVFMPTDGDNPSEGDALFTSTGNTFFGVSNTLTTDYDAVFGEFYFKPLERLEYAFGLRYFRAGVEGTARTTHGFFPGAPEPVLATDVSDSTLTYKFSVALNINDEESVYGLVSKGFRPGGLNRSNIDFAPGIPMSFESDSLTNYEVGYKANWRRNTVRLSSAFYLIDWKNMSLQQVDSSGSIPFIANIGDAEVTGIEVSLTALILNNLEISIGGSVINAKLTEDQPADGFGNNGKKGDAIPNTPERQGFFAVTYSRPIGSDAEFSVRLDANYRSEVNTQFNDQSQFNVELDSYTLANLGFFLDYKSWLFSVYAKNLSDERAQYDAISATQDPLAIIGNRPRTFGASVKYNFN